ncbi:MAG: FMN-binding protein, partial [Pseudoflavonifractor sp.]
MKNYMRVSRRLMGVLLSGAMLLTMAGCGGKPSTTAEPSASPAQPSASLAPVGKFTDGTFTGSANGNNGPIKVTVTVAGGDITAVTVDEHKETAGICEP